MSNGKTGEGSGFKMTERTRAELHSALSLLPNVEDRAKMLDAIASLTTEVELYAKTTALDSMRREWTRNLTVMLSMMK